MKIFKLIWLEAKFLRRTILLIGLIMTAFVAAFLSVISVLLDVPEGMYAGLDEYLNYFTVTAQVAGTDAGTKLGGEALYGSIDGITRYTVLTGKSGASIRSHPPKQEESADPEEEAVQLVANTFSGSRIFAGTGDRYFEDYASALRISGSRFPSAPGEMTINRSVAAMIGVTKLGQTVTLSADTEYKETEVDLTEVEEETYTVVGFMDNSAIGTMKTKNPMDYVLPNSYFYIMTENDHPMSTICFSFPDSRTQNEAYLSLVRSGVKITSRSPERQIDNISLAQAFFAAVSLVLGVMVLFILYSLIAIFFRQRKSQICRLKLLGARGRTIAAVYCTIAIGINFIVTVIGAAFSMLFNLYFMDLCASLFDIFSNNFVSHFRPIIPVLLFVGLSAFTILLFLFDNRRIKNTVIAQEVRHE